MTEPKSQINCPLCDADGGLLVFRNDELRVIQASETGFPAFYRVVWNRHVAEFSDLSAAERETCLHAVVVVEQILRRELQPVKINLAALGNMVPHLHWHVIARFDWDSHFPAAIWANAQRARDAEREAAVAAQLPAPRKAENPPLLSPMCHAPAAGGVKGFQRSGAPSRQPASVSSGSACNSHNSRASCCPAACTTACPFPGVAAAALPTAPAGW